MARRPPRPPLRVGVDLGGTWLRALARSPDGTAARVRVPAVSLPELPARLRTLWRARGWRGRVTALVVASRAVWSRQECARLERRLGGLASRVRVLSDAQGAHLGALGGRPGVLVLAGTGSIVVGLSAGGRWARAGGLGPLLGDEGSAFWLGRAWLRLAARGEDTSLARPLLAAPDPVRRIAALAPQVLTRCRLGDRRARAIVADGARHLAAGAKHVARALGLGGPVAVSWAGGVMDDPLVRRRVARQLARLGVRASWQPPSQPPVDAAAELAGRLRGARPRRP